MASCHEMRVVAVYRCENCGLELQVVKECKEVGIPPEQCKCAPCTFLCCGEELKKKGLWTSVQRKSRHLSLGISPKNNVEDLTAIPASPCPDRSSYPYLDYTGYPLWC